MPRQWLVRSGGTQFSTCFTHSLSHANHLESHSNPILCYSEPVRIEILHQQDFIAVLPVDKLVDHFLRQQHAESTGTHALCLSMSHMAERIFGRVRNGSVGNLVQGKAQTRIVDLARNHMAGTDICDFNALRRIQSTAMLDGI